jgi:hypothetical protein
MIEPLLGSVLILAACLTIGGAAAYAALYVDGVLDGAEDVPQHNAKTQRD